MDTSKKHLVFILECHCYFYSSGNSLIFTLIIAHWVCFDWTSLTSLLFSVNLQRKSLQNGLHTHIYLSFLHANASLRLQAFPVCHSKCMICLKRVLRLFFSLKQMMRLMVCIMKFSLSWGKLWSCRAMLANNGCDLTKNWFSYTLPQLSFSCHFLFQETLGIQSRTLFYSIL